MDASTAARLADCWAESMDASTATQEIRKCERSYIECEVLYLHTCLCKYIRVYIRICERIVAADSIRSERSTMWIDLFTGLSTRLTGWTHGGLLTRLFARLS